MSPANIADVQSRIETGKKQNEKIRAVESLERALKRWRSERKLEGADAALMQSVETFKAAFGGAS